MSTQHTPAPWTTDGDAYSGNLDIIALTGRIAMLDCEFSEETEDVLTANARLIAAAPELLAALQNCVNVLSLALPLFDDESTDDKDSREEVGSVLDAARDALAKATGGGQ